MWYVTYNALLILLSPVIFLILLSKKRCRSGLLARFGFQLPDMPEGQRGTIWVHAVSLGEVMAVVPLVEGLHRRFPDMSLMVSTVTETGREAVETRLKGIARHCYLPLDYPWVINRYIRRIHPVLFIFVETELWPNLLKLLNHAHVPTVLVNGRLSSKSFDRYRRLSSFMHRILSTVSLSLMQSPRDVERLCELGADPDRVRCTGNMKFDQVDSRGDPAGNNLSAVSLGLASEEELIIAGSTHSEEEDLLLSSYETLLKEGFRFVLLIAPRHIERVHDIEKNIVSRGLKAVRRSQIHDAKERSPHGPRIVILDTRGELRSVYRLCQLAFVGGTLTPVGGHNLLEPAFWGKGVVFGPYTDHCEEIASLLVSSGGGIRVRSGEELTQIFRKSLQDVTWRTSVGELGRRLTLDNQGVVKRNLGCIARFLEPNPESVPERVV